MAGAAFAGPSGGHSGGGNSGGGHSSGGNSGGGRSAPQPRQEAPRPQPTQLTPRPVQTQPARIVNFQLPPNRTGGGNANQNGRGNNNQNDRGGNGNQTNSGSQGNLGNRNQNGSGNNNQSNRGNGNENRNGNGAQGDHGNNNQGNRGNSGNSGHTQVQHSQGRHDNNWRHGYDRRAGGPSFSFGFYLDVPDQAPCVASPWYDYPGLPGYLPLSDVLVLNPGAFNWNAGSGYNYNIASLNSAIGQIQAVFQGGNVDDVQNLVQPYTNVNVYNEGQYEYSLSTADFAQMMDDNVTNTQTISFQVTSVKTNGLYATVDFAHTFDDPNGNTQTVYQEYRLQNISGRYYITDFSTSTTPLG